MTNKSCRKINFQKTLIIAPNPSFKKVSSNLLVNMNTEKKPPVTAFENIISDYLPLSLPKILPELESSLRSPSAEK